MKSKTRCLDCNTPTDDDARCKRCERATERARLTGQLRGHGPDYDAAKATILEPPRGLCHYCRASYVTVVAHIPPLAHYASPAHWHGRLVGSCDRCKYERDPNTYRSVSA